MSNIHKRHNSEFQHLRHKQIWFVLFLRIGKETGFFNPHLPASYRNNAAAVPLFGAWRFVSLQPSVQLLVRASQDGLSVEAPLPCALGQRYKNVLFAKLSIGSILNI